MCHLSLSLQMECLEYEPLKGGGVGGLQIWEDPKWFKLDDLLELKTSVHNNHIYSF